MSQLKVAAEGTTSANAEAVWSLVANANSYARWGPWSDGGYRPPASGPSRTGSVQWFRYGRRVTTVEEILEVEEPRRLVYTVLHGIPVRNYRAEVTLSPTPSDGTAICWTATWDKTFLGRMIERRLQRIYVEVMKDLVAAADQSGESTGP